jgi:uncharacterized protein with PIN domain
MGSSTSIKLASIVKTVEALPSETQELLVAEFEDRLAEVSASALSAAQRTEIVRRLSMQRHHETDEVIKKVLSAYTPAR